RGIAVLYVMVLVVGGVGIWLVLYFNRLWIIERNLRRLLDDTFGFTKPGVFTEDGTVLVILSIPSRWKAWRYAIGFACLIGLMCNVRRHVSYIESIDGSVDGSFISSTSHHTRKPKKTSNPITMQAIPNPLWASYCNIEPAITNFARV